MLVRPGCEPAAFRSADRCLSSELKSQSALRPKFGPAASLSVRTANDRAHLKLVSTLSWWLTEYLKKMKKLLSNNNNNNNNNNSNKKKKNDK